MITYYEHKYSLYKINEDANPITVETICNGPGFYHIQKITNRKIVDSILLAKDQWAASNSETYEAERAYVLEIIQS
jgi:hypothetical protein